MPKVYLVITIMAEAPHLVHGIFSSRLAAENVARTSGISWTQVQEIEPNTVVDMELS